MVLGERECIIEREGGEGGGLGCTARGARASGDTDPGRGRGQVDGGDGKVEHNIFSKFHVRPFCWPCGTGGGDEGGRLDNSMFQNVRFKNFVSTCPFRNFRFELFVSTCSFRNVRFNAPV